VVLIHLFPHRYISKKGGYERIEARAYPTMMKFPASPTCSPFSSFVKPQDLAIWRIPAGDGFGGLKSLVTTFKVKILQQK
jgi:hypothetical protein